MAGSASHSPQPRWLAERSARVAIGTQGYYGSYPVARWTIPTSSPTALRESRSIPYRDRGACPAGSPPVRLQNRSMPGAPAWAPRIAACHRKSALLPLAQLRQLLDAALDQVA